MAAVQITDATYPYHSSGRLGPFQDESGNLWIVSIYLSLGNYYASAFRSTDGGLGWTRYSSSVALSQGNSWLDAVFDSANGVIYVADAGGHIQSFTLSNTTWTEVYSSGPRPNVYNDVSGINKPIFLTRRSTGEFVVFYQGPTHSLMGNPYRACYYSRCSAAGVWSAGVEVSGAVKLHHYDAKNACLGAEDRSHFLYMDSTATQIFHRSLNSSNTLDTGAAFGSTNYSQGSYYTLYYDPILAKVVVGLSNVGGVYRTTSGANPTWSADANGVGSPEPESSSTALIYEPTAAKLYVFYRDATSDDVYQNSAPASGTTWGTAAVQDVCTGVTGISTGLIYESLPIGQFLDIINDQPFGLPGAGTQQCAQAFSFSSNITLKAVNVRLGKAGSPTDDVVVEIQTDNSGSPSGTVVATGTTIPASSIPLGSGSADKSFIVSFSQTLSSGVTYWLVVRRSGSLDASNYYSLAYGSEFTTRQSKTFANSAWTATTNDFLIILFPTVTDIGIVFNDSGVYFDKLVLEAPPEPIPPTTQQEKWFALL